MLLVRVLIYILPVLRDLIILNLLGLTSVVKA